jgi:OmpA family protein
MSLRKSAILISSVLFLLATSTFAQAGPRYSGSHHGYSGHNGHSVVIESHNYYPEDHQRSYRHHNKRHYYKRHHRPHWKRHHSRHGHHHGASHVYIEKHVYQHEAPQVVYQQPQPTYYPPAPVNQYSSYNRGNVVGDTLIGGALGAAAGAAIGAVTGNPAAGAQIGAVVGGFGGISRGVLGRGLIW